MFEQFGNKDKIIQDAYRRVPTILYRNNNNCFGTATVIPVFKPAKEEVANCPESWLETHTINNDIECVSVPPGFRLELFESVNFTGEPYIVYGSMREDLEGPACHCLTDDFKNKTSSAKLYRHDD